MSKTDSEGQQESPPRYLETSLTYVCSRRTSTISKPKCTTSPVQCLKEPWLGSSKPLSALPTPACEAKSWQYQAVLELLLRVWITRQCLNYLRVGIVPALLGSWHYQALLQILETRHYLRVGIDTVTSFTRIQYSVLQPSNCVIIAWFYQN